MGEQQEETVPINRIPPEILQEIFARIENDHSSVDERDRRYPFNVMQVNHRWRETALSVWFWVPLEMPYVTDRRHRRALIELAISRISRFPTRPLHLSLESAPFVCAPKRDRTMFTTFLRSRGSQWRSLYLEPLDRATETILFKRFSPNDLCNLTDATLHGDPKSWRDTSMEGLAAVLSTATHLSRLTLQRVILPSNLTHLSHLRLLDVSRCVQDDCMHLESITSLLSAVRNLEILKLSARLWRRGDTWPGLGTHLSVLHTLVVRTPCHDPRLRCFLDTLYAPRVRHVQLEVLPCAEGNSDGWWGSSLIERRWKLETLDALATDSTTADWLEVLRDQSGLTCLVVDGAALQVLIDADKFGEHICPSLEELCVVDGESHVSSVYEFAKLREMSQGLQELKKIRLLHNRDRIANCAAAPKSPLDVRSLLVDTVELYTTWYERPEGFFC